jgi:hypothetical protein
MSSKWQFYVKALWAGGLAALGAVSGGLAAVEGASLGSLPDAVWVSAVVLGLVAFGGILGWQNTPADVATGIK